LFLSDADHSSASPFLISSQNALSRLLVPRSSTHLCFALEHWTTFLKLIQSLFAPFILSSKTPCILTSPHLTSPQSLALSDGDNLHSALLSCPGRRQAVVHSISVYFPILSLISFYFYAIPFSFSNLILLIFV
jgi:hypothetical protein